MLQQPTGFVALCQCGKVFGVVDCAETDHVEAAQTIVKWAHRGCLIIPEFGGTWSVGAESCVCGTDADEVPHLVENLGSYILRRKRNVPVGVNNSGNNHDRKTIASGTVSVP